MLGNFTVDIDTTVDITSRSFLALKTKEILDVSTVEVSIQVSINRFISICTMQEIFFQKSINIWCR